MKRMMSGMQAYQTASKMWKQKNLAGARRTLLSAWERGGKRSIYGMLLMAYILRDGKQPVSEVRQLRELLTSFNGAPEQNLIADAWSLLGSALRKLGENRAAVDALLKDLAH